MVKLELDQVLLRRMKEDDVEMVKVLIKVQCSDEEMDTTLSTALNLCHFLGRRAVKAPKTASFSTSSLVRAAFSSWLCSLQS